VPGSRKYIFLVTFFTCVNLAELCTISYLFAFNLHGLKYLAPWETIADVLYAFSILIQFWTAIPKDAQKSGVSVGGNSTKWEKNMQVIALNYLNSYFFVDFMACMPTLILTN